MPLAQVRTDFLSLLNRDDCTTEDADKFLRLGLGRIQRELRAPPLERVYYVDTTAPLDMLVLPADFIEAIDLFVDSVPLTRMTYRLLTRYSTVDAPRYYARFRNALFLRGAAPAGSRVELLYYGEATPLANDAADNEITTACPDLWVYAALSYAAPHFKLDDAPAYEERYLQVLAQINAQAQADDFSGLQAIQPLYTDPGI